MLGPLPKCKSPGASQEPTCKQTFLKIAASGLPCELFSTQHPRYTGGEMAFLYLKLVKVTGHLLFPYGNGPQYAVQHPMRSSTLISGQKRYTFEESDNNLHGPILHNICTALILPGGAQDLESEDPDSSFSNTESACFIWAKFLVSLTLNFLLYKMGIIIKPASPCYYEGEKTIIVKVYYKRSSVIIDSPFPKYSSLGTNKG